MFTLALLLVACVAPPKKVVVQSGPSVEELRRQQQLQQQQALKKQKQLKLRGLLAQAERALQADRLATPVNDNAIDLFRAVLRVDPDNSQAKSGLQLVVMRYIHLARQALVRSQPDRADYLLARARGVPGVDADNPLLVQLYQDIKSARQEASTPQVRSTSGRLVLSGAELDKKSQAIIDRISELARHIRETDESLLIVARNDAEARWLYKKLREAVPGYRVRGNIKIGGSAYIEVEPPIQ